MIIGTAGHIDHGKTALVRALTGVDTDRLKEEKARGISIDLGFAYLPVPSGPIIGFVDVPGHEKFIHNMLAGAGGIDFVLLVVAADDGVMPQTREHLAIVDLLGLARGIVALTKVDAVPPERRAEVAGEIAALIDATGLKGAEIIPVSAITGEGVDRLRGMLIDAATAHEQRRADGRFRLSIDRSFVLSGIGTVVTGTVLSGTVAVGDKVMVSPSGLAARVRSVHAQNRVAERGLAGQRCALNLAGEGIARDAVMRGDLVVDPDLHAPTDRIDATLRVLRSEPKAIAQWMPVRLHHAAAEVGARIVLLDDGPIAPGGTGRIQLVLDRPIAAFVGDRFIVRDTSARRTIGGGKFLDLRAPARRRRTPERLALLEACAIEDIAVSLGAILDCPPHIVDLAAFARDRALAASDLDAIVAGLGAVMVAKGGQLAMAEPHWRHFRQTLTATLTKIHADNPDAQGIAVERLRRQLHPRLPATEFAAVLDTLAKNREVAVDGGRVRLPQHQARLAAQDEKLWSQVSPLISGTERYRPPKVNDIAARISAGDANVRRMLKLLARMGIVHEVSPDHFFLRDTMAEMVGVAAELATASPTGEFGAAQFRDRLNNGRKVAIEILECFDRHGVTLRRGDLRRINSQRRDQFGGAPAGAMSPAASGREASPVGRPDFKSGRGREPVFGGFDSHSLPPDSLTPRPRGER